MNSIFKKEAWFLLVLNLIGITMAKKQKSHNKQSTKYKLRKLAKGSNKEKHIPSLDYLYLKRKFKANEDKPYDVVAVVKERTKKGNKKKEISIDTFCLSRPLQEQMGLDTENYSYSYDDMHEILLTLCRDKNIRRDFLLMGFCTIEEKPAYIHVDGIITAPTDNINDTSGFVKSAAAGSYFPSPKKEDNDETLAKEILRIFDISKSNPLIGTLLVASITRALLIYFKSVSAIPFFIGESGGYKTSVTLVAQSAYGKNLTRPLSWKNSPKKVKRVASQAVDRLLVINDFTADDMTEESANVIDSLFVSTDDDYTSNINALLMMTAETIPSLERSLKENCLFCLVKKGDIDPDVLRKYQSRAAKGVYAKAIREYIEASLGIYDRLQDGGVVVDRFDEYQISASNELGDKFSYAATCNAADMMLGISLFIEYCFARRYITEGQRLDIHDTQWSNIISLIKAQKEMGYS